MKNYDIIVIGGGPAGVSAALNTCLAGFSVALVEMFGLGGQVLKNTHLDNYPGLHKTPAYELADIFRDQLATCNLERYNDSVTELKYSPELTEPFQLLVGKEQLLAKSVIICTGVTPKPLGLQAETKLIGRGVSYCALCDGNFYQEQVVGVVGSSEMTVKEAIFLADIAKKVYLINPLPKLSVTLAWLNKITDKQNIEIINNTTILDLQGKDFLLGASLQTQGKPAEELPLDGLFVFQGLVPQTGFCPDLAKDEHGFIKTDQEMRTNIPGVFAAGDVRVKDCRSVATAVGDGATAANSVFNYLEQMGA